MSTLKAVNNFRRSLMKKVTRRMGVTHLARKSDAIQKVEIRKVLICRPNHRLGNQLLISPLLQEIAKMLPHARIDLFVKGSTSPVIFKNYENVGNIIQLPKKPFKNILKYIAGWWRIRMEKYDIVMNVVNNSSSGKLSAQFANATYRFMGDINANIQMQFPDHDHIAKYPVYSFRSYISRLGYPQNAEPVPTLDLKLTPSEKKYGESILKSLVNNKNKTICLYTYATGAKCYSVAWWEDFYHCLKAQLPEHNIIEILPVENVSKIGFQAPSYYSTDLREIGSVIANTELFIGADSGMMHLASAAQVDTIGLFKAANVSTYAPYNGKSTGLNVTDSGVNECITAIMRILNAEQA